jgi:raffinose/stachyose/melibiose transport system permease protein
MTLSDAEIVPKKRRDPVLIGLWISLVIVAIIWLAPVVFITFTALKSESEILSSAAFAFPSDIQWSNFGAAWSKGNFNQTFANSSIITLAKVPLGLLISAMAAYALAQINFGWNKMLLVFVLFGAMIPVQVMLAPLFTLVNSLSLIDTYPGVILPYLAFGVPYQVFILHGFFRAVPRELTEAALIDGATHFTIFRRIYLPVSLPVLAALLILDFVSTWNEFAMALAHQTSTSSSLTQPDLPRSVPDLLHQVSPLLGPHFQLFGS